MTNLFQNTAAAIAAVLIVAATWAPVISVSPAEATSIVAPALA